MSVARILKEFDIKPIAKVTKEQQIVLADNVATMISNKFNYIDYGYIYKKLMAAKMYIAIIPSGITRAIYLYEEDTLFISDEEDINSVSEELLYECIHAVQDIRNRKGKIKQLGQCIFTDFKVYAMALNEASVQYIVSRILNREDKYIEAYGIKANTYGINKYPLICNIVKQLLFFSDEKPLVKSTIYSTDEFIVDGVEEIGEGSFETIQDNLDQMLYASEEIIGIKNKLKQEGSNSKDHDEELNRLYKIEDLIRKLYMDSQMAIFTMYFDRLYNRIENLQDIKYYRNRLEDYKDLIGFYTNERQEYFLEYYENYYNNKEEQLVLKEDEIKRKNDLALTVVEENRITKIFNRIKDMIYKRFNTV